MSSILPVVVSIPIVGYVGSLAAALYGIRFHFRFGGNHDQ